MDPVVTVIVSTALDLRFISYGLALIALGACGLCWWRLSSSVLSCVAGGVLLLGASSVGDIIGSVSSEIISDVGSVSYWTGRCVSSSVD
jgi:hypothetical protein